MRAQRIHLGFCQPRCSARFALRSRHRVRGTQSRSSRSTGNGVVIFALALKSLRNRKFTAVLTALSIALSTVLLLGVERIRHESRESFASTISGTDLVVGARTSPVHLLLAAVFHIGNATNNVNWKTYRA